jgi:hypothetical protein
VEWIFFGVFLAIIVVVAIAAGVEDAKNYAVVCECRACKSWNMLYVRKGEIPGPTVERAKCGGCGRSELRQIA